MNYLLYVAYILFFCCLFLTNEFFLAYNFFLFGVAPLALVPVAIEGNNRNLDWTNFKVSIDNPFQTLAPAASPIFCGFLCFGLALVLSSALTPDISFSWFRLFSEYLLTISIFVLVTARLSFAFEDFCGAFFTCFCVIVAVNAIINIYIYFCSLNHLADFALVRLSPSYGRAPDHYYTTGALSYATALAGAAGLLLTETNRLRRFVGLLSGITLFIALCLTQSRGPLFASLAAIFISGVLGWVDKKRWLYVTLPILATGIFFLVPEFSHSFIARADNHRLEIWQKFIKFSLERPILGYGERLTIDFEISNRERLGHAHNTLINAFMRAGFPGFVALGMTYILSLHKTIQLDKIGGNPIPLTVLLTTFFAGFVDFDQILFLSDWQWPSFWLPLGLAVGSESSYFKKL